MVVERLKEVGAVVKSSCRNRILLSVVLGFDVR
jgi:hypothetical protein